MGKDDFRAILNLRREELSLQEERDLLDEAVVILLNFQTWDYRVTELKEAWSKIQGRAEMRRRKKDSTFSSLSFDDLLKEIEKYKAAGYTFRTPQEIAVEKK